jgi:CDP-paratose 2-epimerase
LIIHCAGQPSHDFSAECPVVDFENNTLATLKLLEAVRELTPETTFIFTSTNKVYGDNPNEWLLEKETRYEIGYNIGVDETYSLDQTMHSPFGVSKTAADLMVQEYGRYYGLNTVCFRCGCITGKSQQGVELHGFLNYLCKCAKEGKEYTIYGHKGKQVRDNLHAYDLARAFHKYTENPRPGEVYNMGGGYENSCSILEAIQMIEEISGIKLKTKEGPPRKGDHICYYTNLDKFKEHYPGWGVLFSVEEILSEMLI